MGFEYVPAENPAVDAEYRLVGTEKDITIQVSENGMYTVVEGGYDVAGDEDTFWVRDVMSTRSLARAKEIALALG
jgi:hypothetical protein